MSSRYPILGNRPIDQWRVTDLKEELRRRKLATKGLKEDLVRRLFESIQRETESHEEADLDNGLNSDSFQQEVHSDGQVIPVEDSQPEKDSLESIGPENNQRDSDQATIDNQNSHPDVTLTDQVDNQNQIDDQTPKAVGQEGNQADSDIPSVEHGSAVAGAQKIGDPIEQSVSTEELMVTAKEAVSCEASEQKGSENDHPFQSETTIQDAVLDQKNENPQIPGKGALDPSGTENQVSEVKHHPSSSSSPTNLNPESQDSLQNEPERNTEPPSEDATLEQVQQDNQVSEAEPNLGFQVSSELISSDSVSINKKNELKDNLNANDFPLELEVSKPEMLHSSSADVAPVGGELQPLDTAHEPGVDLGPLDTAHEPGVDLGPSEEVDVAMTAKDENHGKKIESADAGYPEKLNLDRSSGEESMEEDVLESKLVDSNVKPVEGEEKNLVSELHEEGSHLNGKASVSSLEDIPMKESLPVTNAEKRKLEGSDMVRVSEPSKRQRRWNSEPLKVPEHPPSNLTITTAPKALVQPTPKRSFARSDSTVSGDSPKERVVPPSQKSPTTSLRIDRFLRPFTLKQVHELLGKTGKVCSFWMDNIKTHCYVTYSSEEEAVATRNAVYNLQWPPNGGRLLVAEFVDPQEVKLHVDAPSESPVPISPSPKTPSAPLQNQASQHPVRQHGSKQLPPPPPLPSPPTLAEPSIMRERQQLPPVPRKKAEPPKPEPPVLTLDDLFMKTKATPRIYYLPLTEELVAAKRAAQAKMAGD